MSSLHIYLLSASPGSRIPKFVTATDRDGVSVFDQKEPQILPGNLFVDVPSGVEVMDKMLTSGTELLLSQKALAALAGLRMPKDWVVADCELRGRGAKQIKEPYKLCYSSDEHRVFHSQYGVSKNVRQHILSVFEWALIEEQIPDLDLFRGDTCKWFVTDAFVERVFEHHLSGFGFARVPTYPR